MWYWIRNWQCFHGHLYGRKCRHFDFRSVLMLLIVLHVQSSCKHKLAMCWKFNDLSSRQSTQFRFILDWYKHVHWYSTSISDLYNYFGWSSWCAWWHDDVIKWKHFPHHWACVREIHRSPVNSPHKDQWRGAKMFSLICVWINGWVNNREAGDLRRHPAHYDVIVMMCSGFYAGSPLLSARLLRPTN